MCFSIRNACNLTHGIYKSTLVDLGIAKVHLGMLCLELLEDVHLLLLIRRGQALLLLALVVHHLLDHAARLAVEIGQLGGLGLDLGDVDLGRVGDDMRPPLHLVGLVEMDLDSLGTIGVAREGPGRVFDVDIVGGLALLRRG